MTIRLIGLIALALGVTLLTGCISSGHGHSDHNDNYAGVPKEIVAAYLSAEDATEKAELADMIQSMAKGGKRFALLNVLGIEILPVKLGIASESHDHGVTHGGGIAAQDSMEGFTGEKTNATAKTHRAYGIAKLDRDTKVKEFAEVLKEGTKLFLAAKGIPIPASKDQVGDTIEAATNAGADRNVIEDLERLRE